MRSFSKVIRSLCLVLEMCSGKEDVCALKNIESIYKKKKEGKKKEEEERDMQRGRRKKYRRSKHTFLKTYRVAYTTLGRKTFPLSIYYI